MNTDILHQIDDILAPHDEDVLDAILDVEWAEAGWEISDD